MGILSESTNYNLSKSSSKINTGLKGLFSSGKQLDDQLLTELEDLLIESDIGAQIVTGLINNIKKNKYHKSVTIEDIKQDIGNELYKNLQQYEKSLEINPNHKPHTILFIGVNGVGKTTVIGKIAKRLSDQGKKVMIAACDTFRAGAVEQLKIWAERAKCPITQAEKENQDPASVAYQALEKAKKEKFDVLLIDTAGRLQNKTNLMDELKKIVRVMKKLDEDTPNDTIIVLDAAIGQNSKRQIELFKEAINVDGIIMTKLDGSAKGGILSSIVNEYKIPVYGIGVGEKIEDLKDFNAQEFLHSLLEL